MINAGLCLTHDVETAHTLGRVCRLLLFDLQGFFNNVNHDRLTALIDSLGFPTEIRRWTKSFLKDRSVHLHFNSFTSEEIDLEMGMPQGSPISPILSIIYASPLLHLAKCWTDSTFMMCYDIQHVHLRLPCFPSHYSQRAVLIHLFCIGCHAYVTRDWLLLHIRYKRGLVRSSWTLGVLGYSDTT
jgi:retron-type reverse transcriptase